MWLLLMHLVSLHYNQEKDDDADQLMWQFVSFVSRFPKCSSAKLKSESNMWAWPQRKRVTYDWYFQPDKLGWQRLYIIIQISSSKA